MRTGRRERGGRWRKVSAERAESWMIVTRQHARRERVERRPAELGFTASTEVRRALLSGSNGAQAEAAVPPPTRRKVKKPKAKAKAAEAEATDGTKAVEKEAVVEAAVPERSGSCECPQTTGLSFR